MKSFRWRILITLATVALGVWALLPTWNFYRLTEEDRAGMDPGVLQEMKAASLRLGLDLQGGMHLVLEIDDSELDADADRGDVMDRALEVIRNRIDQFGVTEPVVQRAGDKRIIVELAGIDDPERAKEIISQAAVLEFQMVKSGSEMRRLIRALDEELADQAGVAPAETAEADTAAADTTAAGADSAVADAESAADTIEAEKIEAIETLGADIESSGGVPLESRILYAQRRGTVAVNEIAYVAEADFPRMAAYLDYLDEAGAIPHDVEFLWEAESIVDGSGKQVRNLYLVTKQPELTGEVLEDARPQPDSQSAVQGNYMVEFDLSRMGRRLFTRTTGENVGRLMAIVLDERVKSAPEIQGKIRAGTAVITGRFTPEEAKDLSVVLRAGALPVPINIEENRSVGPSLGADSITKGRTAILYGFIGVLLFMVIYYRGAGLVAVAALLLNLLLLLASLAYLDAVLTLPGIAGFVLTVGMAVDANVLIFERIREELRNQQSFRNAVNRGYERAFTTILDANITTLITALALLWFGTGPIKGFAVVLSLGIVVSMFTALFVSRLIFDLLTRPGGARHVPI